MRISRESIVPLGQGMKRALGPIYFNESAQDFSRFSKAFAQPMGITIFKYPENQSCCFTDDWIDVFPKVESTISQMSKE